MIDTVHFRQTWKIHRDVLENPNWKFQTRDNLNIHERKAAGKPWMRATHVSNTIRVYGPSHEEITQIYVSSLGTILNGQNGQPPNGQREFDASLDVVKAFLGEIATPVGEREFTRVDGCLDLMDITFSELESALRFKNLPRSKKAPRRFDGESVTFFRNNTELSFYERAKRLQALGAPGAEKLDSQPRIELRLESPELERELGGGQAVRHVNVNDFYQTIRNYVTSIVASTPDSVHDRKTFFAYLAQVAPELFDLYLRNVVGPERASDLRREVGKLVGTVGDIAIPWANLFPEDHPPQTSQFRYNVSMTFDHQAYVILAKMKHGLIGENAGFRALAKLQSRSPRIITPGVEAPAIANRSQRRKMRPSGKSL